MTGFRLDFQDSCCPVIETGLLLGSDPAALAPVGQPIYGSRPVYEQEIVVAESGEYWLAAYARDEAGRVIQSPPRPVLIYVPPRLSDQPHGSHGPLPFYTGTDADFLAPAGNPHYATLGRASTVIRSRRTESSIYSPTPWVQESIFRGVASTNRDAVLQQQAAPLETESQMVTVTPQEVVNALGIQDALFRASAYPRSGLYTVGCTSQVGPLWPTGSWCSFRPHWFTYGELSENLTLVPEWGLKLTAQVSSRSDLTYLIPKLPPGKRLRSAKLLVFIQSVGDHSAMRLSGKSPAAVDLLFCHPVFPCRMWATWDFTQEARLLATQGGELNLTLDPIPPRITESPGNFLSSAGYTFHLEMNYPWRHGDERNALTLVFDDDCSKKALTVSALPAAIRPVLPLNQDQAKATITATVTTCPSEGSSPPASVEVTFEVKAPAAGSAETGGHAHGTRPLHAFGSFTQAEGPKTATCTVTTFDAEGMGSCTVPYHASEVSGVETIVAQAPGFTEAKAKVRVAVLGLGELSGNPEKYVLVGTPDNHAGTNDPCRSTAPTSRHVQNHFGQPELNAAVVAIAERMLRETGILLRINDMSLPQGGLFDVHSDWQTPHLTHRVGRHVDLGFTGIQSGVCTPYDRRQLQRVILQATKNDPVIERDHFHAFIR